MSFPNLVLQTDSDTTGANQVPDLGTPAVGELLLCCHFRSSPTPVAATGNNWIEIFGAEGSTTAAGIYYKVADGTDTLTISGGNAVGCNIVDKWSNHGGLVEAQFASMSTANTDPPNLAPTWGLDDNAWKVARFSAGSIQATAAPTDFTNFRLQQPASGAARLATAERLLRAASLDPGPFTSAASLAYAVTMAIKPSSNKFFAMF